MGVAYKLAYPQVCRIGGLVEPVGRYGMRHLVTSLIKMTQCIGDSPLLQGTIRIQFSVSMHTEKSIAVSGVTPLAYMVPDSG